MGVSTDITQRDLHRFLADPRAEASWWRRRSFRGLSRAANEQYALSILLRSLVIGFSDRKAIAMVEQWQHMHRTADDLQSRMPELLQRAHGYADPFIEAWTAQHEADEADRAARRAARPRARIMEYLGTLGQPVTAQQVAAALGIEVGTCRRTMLRMSKRQEIDRVAHGWYRSASGAAVQSLPEPEPEEAAYTVDEILARQAAIKDELYRIRQHNKSAAAMLRPRFLSSSSLLDEFASLDYELHRLELAGQPEPGRIVPGWLDLDDELPLAA